MLRTKVVEKMEKHILCLITFFGRNSRSLCDNVEKKKYGRAAQATVDSITRRMRIACSVTKATNTHSGYVILIAFPLPQWLHERTSVLRYL